MYLLTIVELFKKQCVRKIRVQLTIMCNGRISYYSFYNVKRRRTFLRVKLP